MGKGSYIGGSSIVRSTGAFTTFDPAEGTLRRKAKRKADPVSTMAMIRHPFLTAVVKAELRGTPLPSLSLHHGEEIAREVVVHGGLLRWAHSHPCYAAIRSEIDRVRMEVRWKLPSIQSMERHFLHLVINAQLSSAALPEIPIKWRPVFLPFLSEKGGMLSWAETHPEYSKIKEQKALKLQRSTKNAVPPAIARAEQITSPNLSRPTEEVAPVKGNKRLEAKRRNRVPTRVFVKVVRKVAEANRNPQ